MKANEAPEKIYLQEPTKVRTEKKYDNDVEYIRTDAFIEKATNFLEMLGHGFTITDKITHTNYDKEQLVGDFRKYMEGE